LVWVVPLRLNPELKSTFPKPFAVPTAVWAIPSYVTLYGVTESVAVAFVISALAVAGFELTLVPAAPRV